MGHNDQFDEANDELKKLSGILSQRKKVEVTDELLNEARLELRAALRTERRKKESQWSILLWLQEFFAPPARVAIAGAFTLIIGIGVGYLLFFSLAGTGAQQFMPVALEKPSVDQGQMKIQNVRFIYADGSDGDVEFEFEAVTPVHMRGSVSSAEVQRVLAFALLNEQSVGARLNTVNLIARESQDQQKTDPILRSAMIQSAKYDDNLGVRRQAVNALAQMTFGSDIRDAYLFILRNDANISMRISALNNLEKSVLDGNTLDIKSVEILEQISKGGGNKYIRTRASVFVVEARRK